MLAQHVQGVLVDVLCIFVVYICTYVSLNVWTNTDMLFVALFLGLYDA